MDQKSAYVSLLFVFVQDYDNLVSERNREREEYEHELESKNYTIKLLQTQLVSVNLRLVNVNQFYNLSLQLDVK